MTLSEDPFVKELLPEFVDAWINDIKEQFQPLVLEKKGEDLYRLAHTIKGSCFQFGLDDIAQKGIELMGYAKNLEWQKASDMELKILTMFEEVQDYLLTI